MLLTLLQSVGEPTQPVKVYSEIWIYEGKRPETKERRKLKKVKRAIAKAQEVIKEVQKPLVFDDSAIVFLQKQKELIEYELEVLRQQKELVVADYQLKQAIKKAEEEVNRRSEEAFRTAYAQVEKMARVAAKKAYEEEQEDLEMLYLLSYLL